MLRRVLLACGIASSLLYVAMTVFIASRWPEYSSSTMTISELSAVNAPTRPLWNLLGLGYTSLMFAFGTGVWLSGEVSAPLRRAGLVLVAVAAFGIYWPPMHQREVLAQGGGTLTDTLHLVWAAVTVAGMIAVVGFAAAALDRTFRLYSIATIVVMLIFGGLTSMATPAVEANSPTPWLGVWERISVFAYMLWVAVFAVRLWPGYRSNVERLPARPALSRG